jgi:tetratricopeptide (TPR) repeat protein
MMVGQNRRLPRPATPETDRTSDTPSMTATDTSFVPDAVRSDSTQDPSGWKSLLFGLSLIAVLFLVYQPAWQGGLLWDDDAHLPSGKLQSLQGLRRIWTELKATRQYYPVVYSVFWLEYRVWGDHTLGYHLVNIALHAASALLVWRVARRLTIRGAWLGAAIFALHPVQVESVAWISELKNTLSGLFFLAALATYLQFDQRRTRLSYVLALGLFGLALLSKTVTATLPGAVLVVVWWQRGQLKWKRDVAPLVPFLLMAVAGALLSAWMERNVVGAEGAEFNCTWIERCLIAGRAAWFYAGKLLWPMDLVFIYPRWQVSQGIAWQYLFPLAAAGLLLGLWLFRHRSRAPLAAVLFFSGTLFPALGFANVYPFRFSFVADHFQYLACLGPILLTSAAVVSVLLRWPPWARATGWCVCGAMVLVLGGLTWRQCWMYADIQTLYQNTIAKNPACWMPHHNLGLILTASDRFEEAIEHYRQAASLNPDFVEVHYNWGNALTAIGRPSEAIEHYQQAARIKPDFAEVHNVWGNALVLLGRHSEALEHYRQTLKINPEHPLTHCNWGTALLALGRPEEAIEHFEQAVRIEPLNPMAQTKWGNALVSLGRLSEAIEHYQQAVRIEPRYADAHYNWANVLSDLGQPAEAIEHYRQTVQFSLDHAGAQSNWGGVLLGLGRTAEAVEHYREAARIEPDTAAIHINLSVALRQLGQVRQSIEHTREAARLMPDQPQIQQTAAWLLATHEAADGGDPVLAVQLAQRACSLTNRRDAACLDTLAAAYASAGRFDDAVSTAKGAWQMAQAAGQNPLAEEIHIRLQLYRDRKPYREPTGASSRSRL